MLEKLYRYSLIPSIGIILLACGQKTATESESIDHNIEQSNDSLAIHSPFLTWNFLQGPVKTCIVIESPEMLEGMNETKDMHNVIDTTDTLLFNKKGELTSWVQVRQYDGQNFISLNAQLEYSDDGQFLHGIDKSVKPYLPIYIKFDNQGYPIEFSVGNSQVEDENDDTFSETYNWSNGRLTHTSLHTDELTREKTFTYSSDLLYPSNTTVESDDIEGETTVKEEYHYIKFDSLGNWIERRVEISSENRPYGNENHIPDKIRTIRYDRRIITYYSSRNQ